MIFFDTSAAVALASGEDDHHGDAVRAIEAIANSRATLLTHNYVLVESAALLQGRLGLPSALNFLSNSESFYVHWVTHEDHMEAVALLRQRNRRRLSLVDCMSFVIMRKYGVATALAYDSDFQTEGFTVFQ